MSDRAREKGRLAIYAMAGVYLLFMAYQIFKSLPSSTDNSFIILVIAMVAFVIIGAGLIIFGLGRSYKISKEELEERKRLEMKKKLNNNFNLGT